MSFNLKAYGIDVEDIFRNTSVPQLYEIALRREKGTAISDVGALLVYSGEKTGRSPSDKRITENEASKDKVWWGDINMPINFHTWFFLPDGSVSEEFHLQSF